MLDFEEAEVRAGSHVLSLFANPLNVRVLRAHAVGPQRLADVKAAIGWSAESTLRAAVANLCEAGALVKESLPDGAHAVATRLTDAGEEMLFVADTIEAWLARSPAGPVPLDSQEAKGAVKALSEGWSSRVIRELANRPVTLTELSKAIPEISHPSLERRLNWMRMTGQIEPTEREGRGTPYVVTDWLRHAIAPLSVSGRCERRHLNNDSGPITDIEIESAFLMALPLAPLPPHAKGPCLLASQTELETEEKDPPMAGVTVLVEQGEIRSCTTDLSSRPPTWAVGTAEAWLEAVIDARVEDLRIGGADPQLALDLAAGLHLALFTGQTTP